MTYCIYGIKSIIIYIWWMQPMKRFGVIVLLIYGISGLYAQTNDSLWLKDFKYCWGNGGDPVLIREAIEISNEYIEKDTSNYIEKIAFHVVKASLLADSLSPDTSIYYLKKVLPYSLKTNNGDIITRTYWAIGRCYIKKAAFQNAIEYYLQHDYFAEKYGLKKEQVRANYYLSTCFQGIDNYAQSNYYGKRAYKLAAEEKDSFAAAICLQGIGNNFISLNQPDSALVYVSLSRKFISDQNLNTLAYYNGAMGRILNEKDDFRKAKYFQSEAIRLFKQTGDVFGLSQSIENLGHNFNSEGNYDSALICLTESENINEKNYFGSSISLYGELYYTYKNTYNYESAFKYLELFLKEDSMIKKYDVRYIRELKDSFQLEKNDLVIAKEKEHLNDLFVQQTRFGIFIGIAVLGIFVLVILLLYYRYKGKKEKEKNLIAAQLNEVRLRAFQSQMNPHFVFNCLATIDSYILQNRKQEASTMMERFSKLIRIVLENSKQDWIVLEDDIKALKIYLELEQIRAGKKFEFEIKLDESVSRILVPPLIIQPLVENAIVHGVRNIDEGLIVIELKMEEHWLKVTVTDNGVGRKMSEAAKTQKSTINKSSLGIGITLERLKMLDRNKRSLYLEYTDLENPTGTIATIYIPFKH